MRFLFWASLFLVFFTYFGYPLSLLLIGIFGNRRVAKKPFTPFVTLIITAYNEEKRIRQKLENTLNLNYPRDKLDIIVCSDGSNDLTNHIAAQYTKDGVQLLAFDEKRGKEYAQKDALERAKGDVIVFSDVATKLDPGGLQEIVSNFADPTIGCVSSEDQLIDLTGKPVGEGMYVRYEMWLRRLESKVNSLVGLSGSFFAARKDVCRDFSDDMQSDFRTVLNSMKMGLRGISDSDAIGYYLNVSNEKREFDRKVRTVLRGLNVFFRHLELLNFIKYGLFSYQLFCHKLLRWFVPLFLFIALLSNVALAGESLIYFILMIGQFLFYGIAVWGNMKNVQPGNIFLKIPLYFFTVNAAIMVAWWQYLMGKRVVMWEPSER